MKNERGGERGGPSQERIFKRGLDRTSFQNCPHESQVVAPGRLVFSSRILNVGGNRGILSGKIIFKRGWVVQSKRLVLRAQNKGCTFRTLEPVIESVHVLQELATRRVPALNSRGSQLGQGETPSLATRSANWEASSLVHVAAKVDVGPCQ